MKKDIHPTYYPKAKIACACGNAFTVGATKEHIELEVCSACHPFYTGQGQGSFRGSRVERFQKRLARHENIKQESGKKPPRKERQKKRPKKEA